MPANTSKESQPKNVLFVCVHNSGRSKMAEAFFNRYAHGEAVAESAGTEPPDAVNPVVVAAMKEVGFDLSQMMPHALTAGMTQDIARTVTMGCLDSACPLANGPSESWTLHDPKGKDLAQVRKIRDEIKRRVITLIESLGIKPEDIR